tara:strand:- start:241 stop:489 length:249 start_codon:yes stop_codon:yes gene_type:complete
MEHFTIDLGDKTTLNVSYEYDPGESGTYEQPPSIPMISIESLELFQFDGNSYHTIQLFGIDDTLFPVDYGMIEHMIQKHIEQ